MGIRKLELAQAALREFGAGGVLYRAAYTFRRRSGLLKRRFPARGWDARPLAAWLGPGVPADAEGYARFRRSACPPFFFEPGCPPQPPAQAGAEAVKRAEEVLAGRLLYFSSRWGELGFPFDWFLNPFTGQRAEPGRHWCDAGDFEGDRGDIKFIWEPGRFAWVYDLVRAFGATREERLAAGFWELVDSWREANPPNLGPHWQCGQECALRAMSLCFGLYAFAGANATTPERLSRAVVMLAEHGRRIEGNIAYARSQRNNHALSEATGLLTIGLLFPELRRARHWAALGRRILIAEIRRQVYADGAYIQHSMNYHRVMLHVLAWAFRVAELAGERFPPDCYEALARAGEFLFQMSDPDTGRVPNYGNNDGALVLPLTAGDYADVRPAIQLAHAICHRRRLLPAGPWDEALLWLLGHEGVDLPVETAREPESRAFEAGGYYTLRRGKAWAMVRCHTYRDRQTQCDTHHVDLWWRGVNVLQDCGTYHYYVPDRPDVEYYFKSAAAHNNIVIDGADPARLVSRFLWSPRSRARKREFVPAGNPPTFTGVQYDYDRTPWHAVCQRTVRCPTETCWEIIDEVRAQSAHVVTLRWHMVDGACRLDAEARELWLTTPAGTVRLSVAAETGAISRFELIRGRDDRGCVQGFASHYYGTREAIPVLEVDVGGSRTLRIITRIDLGAEGEPA